MTIDAAIQEAIRQELAHIVKPSSFSTATEMANALMVVGIGSAAHTITELIAKTEAATRRSGAIIALLNNPAVGEFLSTFHVGARVIRVTATTEDLATVERLSLSDWQEFRLEATLQLEYRRDTATVCFPPRGVHDSATAWKPAPAPTPEEPRA